MYQELPVSPTLAGVVEAVWVRSPARQPGAGPSLRVLPDGCTDLIWVDGELLVAGPDRQAQLAAPRRGAYVAVRFVPGAGPTIFGVPGKQLRDLRISLGDLWPAGQARRLADQLTHARDRPAALQAIVAHRLAATGPPDPLTTAIAGQQEAGVPVAATADALGFSERQLHRRCLAAFGYGPKTLARILRFRRGLALARAGVPAAEVATRAGYADQPHLAREVRALAGVSLRELVPAPAGGDRLSGSGVHWLSGANRSIGLPSGSRTRA